LRAATTRTGTVPDEFVGVFFISISQ